MRWVFTLTMLGAGALYLQAAPVDKQKSSVKPATPSGSSAANSHKTNPSQSAHATASKSTRTASAHSTRRSGKRAHARSKPAPSYQLHPDPERYQEIQKALAERGYFKGEVNGVWGDDSVDALKRFQHDQNLADDGKITALSLTGLGLGPKHDGSTISTASPPVGSPVSSSPPESPPVGGNAPPATQPPER